jgi:cell division protein FtsI/penicillin-binding protein 2
MVETLSEVNEQITERDAFAVMDIYSGRILWHHNPVVLAQRAYQPGSIFKLITSYAALTEDKVDRYERFDCQGIGTDNTPCWLRTGHGEVNLAKALALSCNLFFANLGPKVGAGPILKAARDFGLGQKTGSDLPDEISGLLPESVSLDKTARLATGQLAGLNVTPLQMLSIVGAIANGGELLAPTLHLSNYSKMVTDRSLIDAEVLRFLRNTMQEASIFGTGSKKSLAVLKLAGKTGTSAWNVGWKTHAWYIGFAPYGNPRYALVIFVYKGQGSKEAAGTAASIVQTLQSAEALCGIFE